MVDPAIEKTILSSRHLERCGCRNQLNLYFFIALPCHPYIEPVCGWSIYPISIRPPLDARQFGSVYNRR